MEKVLQLELDTWNLDDSEKRAEKLERERVRYPKMLQEMGVDLLDTEGKVVVDIGSGPISALRFIKAKTKIAVDPLIEEYRKVHLLDPGIEWVVGSGEKLSLPDKFTDLVICMNTLDHVKSPKVVIGEVSRILRAGGFFGVHCCEANASITRHRAHIHDITYEIFRKWVDSEYETVHERTYEKDGLRYGWYPFKGKVGQPCFAFLGRKISDYE